MQKKKSERGEYTILTPPPPLTHGPPQPPPGWKLPPGGQILGSARRER